MPSPSKKSVGQRKNIYFRAFSLDALFPQAFLESDYLLPLESYREKPLLPWVTKDIKSNNTIDVQTIDKGIEFGWWVEIFTLKPICLYYFGSFDQRLEATLNQDGYIEDLLAEGTEIMSVQTKRCQPSQLTLSHQELNPSDFKFLPSLIEIPT